jgi:hypothetical protein
LQDEAEPEQDQGTPQRMQQQLAATCPAFQSTRRRQREGESYDPEEGREDGIGNRPTVPGRVSKGRVRTLDVHGTVDQDHAGDGHPSEDVERRHATRRISE